MSSRKTSGSPQTHPRIYCCSNGCLNSSIKKPHMSFFKLPRDEQRRNEWLRLISREDLCDKNAKSYVVCEEHFHAHEILRAEHRKNLKKNAIPSLNLPGAQSNEVVAFEVLVRTDTGTQTDTTDDTLNRASSSSRKRKLKLKRKPNKKFRQKDATDNSEKETFHKMCDRFLSRELAELVKVQTLAGCGRNKLSLSITTEINEKVMSILQIKVQNMAEKAKNCSLIIDTMDLKPNLVYDTRADRITGFHEVDGVQTPEPATAALVLMLRGIVFKWQQSIGFALLSEYRNYDEVWKWIDKLVSRLLDMGLHVRAFVSDTSTDVYNLAKMRLISPEKPFFFNTQNKLFYVFDPPHLLRQFRDRFLINNFNYQGRVANVEPVREFYDHVKEKNSQLLHLLTESHFRPDGDERNDHLLAVQLLSHSVAAAMSTYIDFYVMDESARDTVKVIKLMHDLFEILNSVKGFSAASGQLQILSEATTFFKSLKLVDRQSGQEVTSTARFIEGFQTTVNSVMMMFEDLKKQHIELLRTKWLRKDLTEKLFSEIISKTKVSGHPKGHQFVSAFQELLVIDLMKPPRGKNCSFEVAKLLAGLQTEDLDQTLNPATDSKDFVQEMEKSVKVKCSDYNNLEHRHEHTAVFLSSFLLKRCRERHEGCQAMTSYVTQQKSETFGLDKNYQRYRDYSRLTKTSLLVAPTDSFVSYVEMMDQEFRSSFKRKHINKDIARSIYNQISAQVFVPPCPCFPFVYLKKLFIRMRIFQTIQFNNKNFQSLGSKRKYFNVPQM